MKRFLGLLFGLLIAAAGPAAADKPVNQTGNVTVGHVPVWSQNGIIGDAGPALNGKISEIGITNTGLPFCINDALPGTPGGYHQLCLGANSAGGGLITYNAFAGASPLPLILKQNGTQILGGNFSGPSSSIAGDVVVFGDASGIVGVDTGLSAASIVTFTNTGALSNKTIDCHLNTCLNFPGGGGGSPPGGVVGQTQFNLNGVAFGGYTPNGDATINVSTGVVTVVSTAGVPFAPSATTNALNASNISSGTLPNARIVGLPLTALASQATGTVLGNISGLLAPPIALTSTQLTTLCNVFNSTTSGCVPASGGGTTNFLRADGTWAAAGGGGGGSISGLVAGQLGVAGSATSLTSSVPFGLSGSSIIVQSNPSGFISNSLITGLPFGSMATMGTGTVLGNVSGLTATPAPITGVQLTTLCVVFTSGTSGCVPASGGSSANFLRADGIWAVPPGGGGGGSVTSVTSASAGLVITNPTTTPVATLTVPENSQAGASYTILAGDATKVVLRTNAGAQTDTLPQATGSFGAGWSTTLCTTTAKDTISPTVSTINGLTNIVLGIKQCVFPVSDGTNYFAGLTLPAPVASAVFTSDSTGAALWTAGSANNLVHGDGSIAAVTLSGAQVTGALGIGNGGTGATTLLAARVNLGIDQHSQYGAAATNIAVTDQYVTTCNNNNSGCSTGTWNTAATWTLPASTAVNDGDTIIFADDPGVLTNTNTLSIAPNGTDTINGLTSAFVLNAARTKSVCQINKLVATHNWTCVGSITNGAAGSVLIGQGVSTPGSFAAVTGDWTITTAGVVTVAKVNGVAYPASPANNTLPVVTSSNTITYEAVPNSALANSGITLNTHLVSLGGTLALTAADVSAGGLASNNTWTGENIFSGSLAVPYRTSTSATITVDTTADYLIAPDTTSGAITVQWTCPAGRNFTFLVKDKAGTDKTNAITLSPQAGGHIDGATGFVMNASVAGVPPFESHSVTCTGGADALLN